MRINFNKTCSSHVPILLEVMEKFSPYRILEFGCGLFSTGTFLKYHVDLTSIEIGNFEWYSMIKRRFAGSQKLNLVYEKEFSTEILTKLNEEYDLIFIDCHTNRTEVTNWAFNKSNIIICHDTQVHWVKGIKPDTGYSKIHFIKFPVKYKNHRKDAFADRPWTTLFTKSAIMHKHFLGAESRLYSAYQFPYWIKL